MGAYYPREAVIDAPQGDIIPRKCCNCYHWLRLKDKNHLGVCHLDIDGNTKSAFANWLRNRNPSKTTNESDTCTWFRERAA